MTPRKNNRPSGFLRCVAALVAVVGSALMNAGCEDEGATVRPTSSCGMQFNGFTGYLEYGCGGRFF
ncbi:MAG: hypothetical protein DCC65_17715 [Planctomycetota bacterium]|nr:MAG: hypothetical protein DCC65_17715 [Planctomycetota bacterium]